MDTIFHYGFKSIKMLKDYINFTDVHIWKSLNRTLGI
jgi:hypothetical protein